MSQLKKKIAVIAMLALVFGLLSSTMSMTVSAAPISSPAGPRLMSQDDSSIPEEVVEEEAQPEVVEEIPDPVENLDPNPVQEEEIQPEVVEEIPDPVDTEQNTETNTDTETDESTDPQESEEQTDPDDVPVEVPATDEEEIPDEEPDGEYFIEIGAVSLDCSTGVVSITAFSSIDAIAIPVNLTSSGSSPVFTVTGRIAPGAWATTSASFGAVPRATVSVNIQGSEDYRGNASPYVFDCSGGTDPEPDPPVLSVSQSGCTGINVSRSGGEDGVVYTITVTVNDVIVATFDASTQLVPATLVTGDVVEVSTSGATSQSITVIDCDESEPIIASAVISNATCSGFDYEVSASEAVDIWVYGVYADQTDIFEPQEYFLDSKSGSISFDLGEYVGQIRLGVVVLDEQGNTIDSDIVRLSCNGAPVDYPVLQVNNLNVSCSGFMSFNYILDKDVDDAGSITLFDGDFANGGKMIFVGDVAQGIGIGALSAGAGSFTHQFNIPMGQYDTLYVHVGHPDGENGNVTTTASVTNCVDEENPGENPGHEGPVLGNPPVMPEAPLPAKVDTVSADSQATTLPVTGSVPVSRDSDLLGYLSAIGLMVLAVAFGVRRGRGVFHG